MKNYFRLAGAILSLIAVPLVLGGEIDVSKKSALVKIQQLFDLKIDNEMDEGTLRSRIQEVLDRKGEGAILDVANRAYRQPTDPDMAVLIRFAELDVTITIQARSGTGEFIVSEVLAVKREGTKPLKVNGLLTYIDTPPPGLRKNPL